MPPTPPTSDDTRPLTTAMARGERAAVETFYRRHFDRMLADARRLTRRDEHFCLDVVQDATLKIVRSVRVLDDVDQLRRWVRRVVLNTAIDRLRQEQRRRRREECQRTSDAPPGPVERAIDAEHLVELRRRLDRLDPASRRLLQLRHVRGLTLADIGQRLGLGPGAIHGRLRRILRRLATSDAEQP